MEYLAEHKRVFDPNYDLSAERDGRKKEFEFGMDPLEQADPEELINTDNFYTYEESNQPYEPQVQPYSYFYVSVAGQIEFGEFMELDGLAIRYAFVHGDDWQIATGDAEGHGQFSFKAASGKSGVKRMVWNLPFDIQFRSMTPHGWPQLVLYCLGRTSEGAEFVKAYGSTHIPIEPGMHSKKVRMFSPIETGTLAEYFGFQREGPGISSIISNPQAIASSEGREVSRVMATGKVQVQLQVTQRNIGRHGYLVSS